MYIFQQLSKYCILFFSPRSVSSIRGELIPYLVRKQFSKSMTSPNVNDEADQNLKKKDGNPNLGNETILEHFKRVSIARL